MAMASASPTMPQHMAATWVRAALIEPSALLKASPGCRKTSASGTKQSRRVTSQTPVTLPVSSA